VTGGRIAVFVDRDGTLNEEVEFLRTPEELSLIPGAAAAVRTLNTLGIITCVISNQSGVARGYLTEDDLIPIHARLEEELQAGGAHVDRIYYCPHHPTEGDFPYKIACDCRKPNPGMLKKGEIELGIDLRRSFVIGDRIADIQAGQAVGARTVLVLTGYGKASLAECQHERVTPDFIAPSIVEAVEFIEERISGDVNDHE
jgi:D-glycero-D-manno-heptose 1,7-bisphosphate phosphatase